MKFKKLLLLSLLRFPIFSYFTDVENICFTLRTHFQHRIVSFHLYDNAVRYDECRKNWKMI